MINVNFTDTQACFGTPAAVRVRTAWSRALGVVVLPGGVDVQGTGVSKHRLAMTGATFPGTSAWSPPV